MCVVEVERPAIRLVPDKKTKARKTCEETEPRLERVQGRVVPSGRFRE